MKLTHFNRIHFELVPNAGIGGGVSLMHRDLVKANCGVVRNGNHAMLDVMVVKKLPEQSLFHPTTMIVPNYNFANCKTTNELNPV